MKRLSLLAVALAVNLCAALAYGATELPASFYQRQGLEAMPRLSYAGLEVINLRELGALGDGMQDAEPYFERAFELACQREGGVIYIPAGIYVFRQNHRSDLWTPGKTDAGWQKSQDIHFLGEGRETIIKFEVDDANYARGWTFGPCERISIRDLTFTIFPYFDRRSPRGMGIYPLRFGEYAPGAREAKNIYLINLYFDQGILGPWLQDTENAWVIDCAVRNTSADGIHLDNTRNCTVAYCTVENSGDDGLAAIASQTGQGNRSWGNRFLYNQVSEAKYARGLTLGGANVQAVGNWIEAVNCAGISFNSGGHDGHSGYPLTDALVKENTIIRPALNERPDAYRPVAWKAGIRVEGEVEGAEITANRIFGSEHNGILISPGPAGDLLIEGNEIQRFKDSGISVPQGSAVDNLTIKDNEIIGSRPLEIEADGAVLEGNIFKTYPSGDDSDYQDVYKCYRFEYETGWRQKPQEAGRGALEINVRSCGAKGDGRNNDLPAFCAALAQIPQEGGTVYIPEGTYYLAPLADKETFPFTIIRQHLLVANRAKIALRGEGEQTVLLFASQFHQGIRLVNVQNAVLKDLTLQLSRQPQVRTNRALLDLSACGKVTVRNVTCKDSAGPAIQVDASTGIVIEDCRITNAGTHGIRLCASRQVWLQNNAIADSRDNGIFISYYGSISREAQYIEVSGNTIAGTKEGFGISLTSGNHVEITNNIIRQTYQAGIAIYPLAFFFPKSVRIQANELRECNLGALSYTEGAISLYSLPRGAIECSGNSISQTGTGIWVSGCLLNDLIMEANDFQACEVASDLSQEQREQILDQRVSPPALRNDGPKIVVSDAEISGGKYVYQLTFAEMTAAPGNKFATDLSESENIKLVSTPRERYVIPVPGTSGYFLYVFDFSQASYRPVHLVLRDGFYSILDGSIAQSFISTDGLDWTAMNQHLAPGKSTLSFCTQEEGLLVRGQMPERVYYLVTFNATQSEFQGSQTQWNRLLEGDNDRDKCFRLEFDVERIAP